MHISSSRAEEKIAHFQGNVCCDLGSTLLRAVHIQILDCMNMRCRVQFFNITKSDFCHKNLTLSDNCLATMALHT